ncbi:MAG: gp16 family protein [Desulfovibrionaceae bacterium]
MRPESRKSLLAKIHIARKDLGLDEDTYRAMLDNLTGKASAAKLSVPELVRVVADLRRQGWQGQPPAKPASRGGKPQARPEAAPYLAKIEALLAEAKRPWSYALGVAKRMYRAETLEWLTAEQMRGVMVALSRDAARNGRQA